MVSSRNENYLIFKVSKRFGLSREDASKCVNEIQGNIDFSLSYCKIQDSKVRVIRSQL